MKQERSVNITNDEGSICIRNLPEKNKNRNKINKYMLTTLKEHNYQYLYVYLRKYINKST